MGGAVLGEVLAEAGDVDRDGVPDLAASRIAYGSGDLPGEVRVFSGGTGRRLGEITRRDVTYPSSFLKIRRWLNPLRK